MHCPPLLDLPGNVQLLNKIPRLTVFLHNKKHIPHVHSDTPLQIRLEYDIATHCFPVAIESQPQQFSFSIEHGTAGITSCYIIVGDKANIHIPLFIGISSEITGGKQI